MSEFELNNRIIADSHEWMLENLQFAYVIVDSDFRLLEKNSKAVELFPELEGLQIGEVVSKDISDMLLSSKKRIKYNDKILEIHISSIHEDLWLEGYCIAIYDATKRQQFIKNLLSEVSFEIRTPMNVIMGLLDVVSESTDPEAAKENLEIIRNAGRGLVNVATEVLAAAGDSLDADEEEGEKNTDVVFAEASSKDFKAPNAKTLLVEDDAINTKVALHLLKPLGMKISTAKNGMEAVSMIKEDKYDLVLMDYLMPEMDGVEATREIRALEGDYFKTVPIVALSANVMPEARNEFLAAGMDDALEKPIEIEEAKKVIRKWLPARLVEEEQTLLSDEEEIAIDIKELDLEEAKKNCGSTKLLLELLVDFEGLVDSKIKKISELMSSGRIKDVTIEVHALKNNARMIGALELSNMFAEAEMLGSRGDVNALKELMPSLFEKYSSVKNLLSGVKINKKGSGKQLSDAEICEHLNNIKKGIESFELDTIDAAVNELADALSDDRIGSLIEKLQQVAADVNLEEIEVTANEILAIVK